MKTNEDPYAFEGAVLGAILIESKCVYLILPILKAVHFKDQANGLVYAAIVELAALGKAIDTITVTHELKARGQLVAVGGAWYISHLTVRVASSANIEAHARIIVQEYIARQSAIIAADVIRSVADATDAFETVGNAVSQFHKLIDDSVGHNAKGLKHYIQEVETSHADAKAGRVAGVPSLLDDVNKNAGGYHKGELIIIAGRPGMGKTSMAINEMYHQLELGKSVCIHSLEIPGRNIIAHLIALHINKPPSDVHKGAVGDVEFAEGVHWAKKLKLKIYESPNLNQIEMSTLMQQGSDKVDIMYIDYLQLVMTKQTKIYERVSHVSMSLKQLAKKADIPIIALAQLNRSVEQRGGDKIPILSDLRESGQIEQDADVIDFMYRPEIYGITETPDGKSTIGKAFRINAKMRSAEPNHRIEMEWNGLLQKLWVPKVMKANMNWNEPF